jgi:hypothetical protein
MIGNYIDPLKKEMPIMANDTQTVTIEGFITDLAFVDRSKATSGLFTTEVGQVAAVTPKVLSYFSDPVAFEDKRPPANRTIGWSATTNAKLVIDKQIFPAVATVFNNLSSSASAGFFKIIDKIFFNHLLTDTRASIETYLNGDADIDAIYVNNSFSASQTLVSDTVYLDSNTSKLVSVPAFVDITLSLLTGTVSTNYVFRLYTSVEAWVNTYNISTIVKVIPPLPYDQLYSASLINSNDNIFDTATITATLSFTTTQALLGSVSVSGMTEYKAVLSDPPNKTSVPFNLLYKGRKPTLYEVRNAIKQALADSGVGNEAGWRLRIPGIYVEGRFYIVPLWDKTYIRPGQIIYPNIMPYNDIATATTKIISSLGYGDITSYMDVFTMAYNRMTATAIPDLTGTVNVYHLAEIIPDYQNCATSDEQFAYMQDNTQDFSRDLNLILAVDSGVQSSTVYTPDTEGLLTFYSFTVEKDGNTYELCVITKQCYTTIMESVQ